MHVLQVSTKMIGFILGDGHASVGLANSSIISNGPTTDDGMQFW